MIMTIEQKLPDPNQKPKSEGTQKEPLANGKPAVKKPRGLGLVFNKDSRLGRVNRTVVRSSGWAIAFFALGFLAVYLLLYVPLSQEYERLSTAYNGVQQQLRTVQATQEASTKGQTSLDRTKISNDILDFNSQVLQTELALSQHDQQGATYFLKKLQSSAEPFLLEANKVDPDLANMLDARLKMVAAEMNNDPKAAQADLEVVVKYLQAMVSRLSQ
jgi:hypothetical protein